VNHRIRKRTAAVFTFFALGAVVLGGAFGAAFSVYANIVNTENFTEFSTALPTRLLDINGEVITEFAADEKREIIGLKLLPQTLLDALITREDGVFFAHHGFSVKAILRAALGVVTRRSLGGGSTLTQQIAGTLYTDRTEISLTRKLKELWWAIQMERRFSKEEILEQYLNKIYFGGGTYGVNAASKYYFGHSAETLTPAESAILVIQLSNPAYYNPFDYPNRAMERQRSVLDDMVRGGYLSRADADASFEDFWLNFDYTRISSSAYFMRDDRAPWFSEYVRRELSSMIYGAQNIYTAGFTVNTTLNLKHQKAAEETMDEYITYANDTYRSTRGVRISSASTVYAPLSDLLSLLFNLGGIKVSGQRHRARAVSEYKNKIHPVVDLMSLMFGMESLKTGPVSQANELIQDDVAHTKIEGTLITLENETGHITALVGGSRFDSENQYIRAVQATLQPGSTFKPLYYSAAIDSRKFTAATQIDDTPVVFYNESGRPYIPANFMGRWEGSVQLWYALATSMNVPSVRVMDGIGFDAAISRATALLGIPREELPGRGFDRVYPLALGTCSVRPIELARAYAVFANQGKEVTPFAIRSVEDRTGRVILNPERDLRVAQQEKGAAAQIISPQTAYIMTTILQNSVRMGTLASSTQFGTSFRYQDDAGRSYTLPAAGKTGTTQNWSDAWAVGFTPYVTTAVWFGFDKRGETLGLSLTGATLSGRAWARYMRTANEDYPYRDFAQPQTGLVKAEVCSVSGLLLTPACGTNRTTQFFLEGTQPVTVCTLHTNVENLRMVAASRLEREFYQAGAPRYRITDSSPLTLDLSFLNEESPRAESPASPGDGEVQAESPKDKGPLEKDAFPEYNFYLD
jgi:penicillin-binding protein 1A